MLPGQITAREWRRRIAAAVDARPACSSCAVAERADGRRSRHRGRRASRVGARPRAWDVRRAGRAWTRVWARHCSEWRSRGRGDDGVEKIELSVFARNEPAPSPSTSVTGSCARACAGGSSSAAASIMTRCSWRVSSIRSPEWPPLPSSPREGARHGAPPWPCSRRRRSLAVGTRLDRDHLHRHGATSRTQTRPPSRPGWRWRSPTLRGCPSCSSRSSSCLRPARVQVRTGRARPAS